MQPLFTWKPNCRVIAFIHCWSMGKSADFLANWKRVRPAIQVYARISYGAKDPHTRSKAKLNQLNLVVVARKKLMLQKQLQLLLLKLKKLLKKKLKNREVLDNKKRLMNNQPFFCLFLNCNNQIFRDFNGSAKKRLEHLVSLIELNVNRVQ